MARNFTITTPTEMVRVGSTGRADMVFTVTNATSAPQRALVRAMPLGTTRAEWLSIAGEAEREFAAGGVQQFTVSASFPPGTPPGRYSYRLDVLSASRAGEDREEGPSVAFEVVAAEEPEKKSLWWLWIAIAVLLAILAVVGYLVWRGRDDDVPKEPERVDLKAEVPRNGIALWLAADEAQPNPGSTSVDFWQNPEIGGPRASVLNIAGQPLFVPNALNGHAVVRFDGVDDMLRTNVEFGRGRMQAATVFAVFNSATESRSPLRKLYGCDNGGFDPAAGLDTRAAMNYGVFTGSGVHPYFALTANRYYLTSDLWQWTSFSGWVDGRLMIDRQPINSDTNTLDALYLGGTGPVYRESWHGDIAEVIVYSRALEDEERRKVEDYLAEKYALTLNR